MQRTYYPIWWKMHRTTMPNEPMQMKGFIMGYESEARKLLIQLRNSAPTEGFWLWNPATNSWLNA